MIEENSEKPIRYITKPVYQRRKPEIAPLRLSPSSIATFDQCRQRYKFIYIDKLADQYAKPRPYFTMANHVHQTVKDFLSLYPIQRRTTAAIEELLMHNWQRYQVGFRDSQDEMRWRDKALAQLKAFVNNHDVSIRPLMLEEFVSVEITEGLILRGRIDRVDKEADGGLHIIDYKTGNMPQEMEWTQLELDALILSRRLSRPVSKVSYLYLGPSLMQTTSISAAQLDHICWEVLNTAGKIRRERRFRPSPGLRCGDCEFLPICPGRVDAEPLAASGGQLELWDDLGDEGGGGQ